MTDKEKFEVAVKVINEVFDEQERAVFVLTGLMFVATLSPGDKEVEEKKKALTLGLAKHGLTIEDLR